MHNYCQAVTFPIEAFDHDYVQEIDGKQDLAASASLASAHPFASVLRPADLQGKMFVPREGFELSS